MSTSLSISFIPKDKNNYSRIYDQLSKWVEEKTNSHNLKEVLDFAEYTRNEIKNVNSLDILESNKAVIKEFFLINYKPFELNCDLWLYGMKYNQGYPCKTDGNVRIILDERDIWGHYRRELLKKEEFEKAREYEITVLFEISELFSDLVLQCEPYIEYASFYTESGISTPLTSSMAYYREVQEFIKDYTRILIESRLGISILDFYSNESNFPYASSKRIKNDSFYKSFLEDLKGSLYDFINSINEEDLKILRKISYTEAIQSLNTALEKNPNIVLTKTKEGFTLSTYPLSSLWPLYYDFLNLYR